MRCAKDHSCDRFVRFPYENRLTGVYTEEAGASRAENCDVIGMSSFTVVANDGTRPFEPERLSSRRRFPNDGTRIGARSVVRAEPCYGMRTIFPMKRTVPDSRSRRTKMNGRSTRNGVRTGSDVSEMPTFVTAAASVPSSFTST